MVKVRGYVEESLIQEIKQTFPETKDLKTTALLSWALQKILSQKQ